MKILEIDHGRLDISVKEPIQHVIIHTLSVNLKNVNMLDVICLCPSNAPICTIGSAHGAQTEEEKTLEVRGFRESLAIGLRALFHSRTSEASTQVRTSSELTFPYS